MGNVSFKSCYQAVLGLTVFSLLAANAPAAIITYVWQTTTLNQAVYPLISANGYFSLDSSLFNTNNSNQTIYFNTGTATNVTAFHFQFVTNKGMAGGLVTDTFDISNIKPQTGASFNCTTNPPLLNGFTGSYSTDENNEALGIGGSSQAGQINIGGAYNEEAEGTFVASNNAAITVNTTPTNLVFAVSGTNLNLSWPTDHLGWRLLEQTNHLASGVSGNTNDWGTVANSASTNQIIIPIIRTNPTEFFRLVYP